MLEFANSYGAMGEGASVELDHPQAASGEPVDVWLNQIWAMRQLITLWDAIRNNDTPTLRKRIVWAKDGVAHVAAKATSTEEALVVSTLETPATEQIASMTVQPEVFAGFKRGDLVAPALAYLRTEINQRLRQLVRPHLEPDQSSGLALGFMAVSLLGAMWLQFAQAVGERTDYRPCRECGNPMAVPRPERRMRIFCSNAWRFRAYRERQQRVRQLHPEGRAVGAIAAELGVEVETVQRWSASGEE